MQALVDENGQLVRDISKSHPLRDVARHKDRIRVFCELVWKNRPLESNNYVRGVLQSMAPEVIQLLQLDKAKDFVEWEGFKKVSWRVSS